MLGLRQFHEPQFREIGKNPRPLARILLDVQSHQVRSFAGRRNYESRAVVVASERTVKDCTCLDSNEDVRDADFWFTHRRDSACHTTRSPPGRDTRSPTAQRNPTDTPPLLFAQ